MTALSDRLGFVGYALESSFGDQATSTYSARMQVRDDAIDVSGITQEMLDPGGVYQRMNETGVRWRGPKAATFSITLDLTGYGSTTAGAIAARDLTTLLGYCFGNATVAQVGGAITTNSGDAVTLTSTNTSGIAVGDLLRVGVKGDARADGQAVVSASSSSPYTLLTAMPGLATTADSIYAMAQVYPATNTGTISNTLRFILGTSNGQWWVRGCACTGATFSFPDGGIPQVTLTFAGVEWDTPSAVTFPSATATGHKAPTPNAGGSMYVQTKGTTTRATYNARDVEFTLDQQVVPVIGTGGSTGYQTIVAWRRVRQQATLSFSVMSEATGTYAWSDYWNTSENSIVARHILYTFGAIDGKGGALYLPDAIPVGSRPTQERRGDLNYVRLTFMGRTNDVTTNELTLANWRMGLG